MKISPNLYGRMDGSKFWCFPWFPENSLLCVIFRYTVYIDISSEQKFEPWIKQNQIVILKNFAYLTFEALENDEEVEVFLSVLS